MAEGRKASGTGKAHPPPLTRKQFEATAEFTDFKRGMTRLLAVPKAELDELVRHAKKTSPRTGNPKAAGRKRKIISDVQR